MMQQDLIDVCTVCGNVLEKTSVCPFCSYEFSLDLGCPRLQNFICIHTRKPCTERVYELCSILRENDD